MSLVFRRKHDEKLMLHGTPPSYTNRTVYYPTNSDITTTTKNLSQHAIRSNIYKQLLGEDQRLRPSLRSLSRSFGTKIQDKTNEKAYHADRYVSQGEYITDEEKTSDFIAQSEMKQQLVEPVISMTSGGQEKSLSSNSLSVAEHANQDSLDKSQWDQNLDVEQHKASSGFVRYPGSVMSPHFGNNALAEQFQTTIQCIDGGLYTQETDPLYRDDSEILHRIGTSAGNEYSDDNYSNFKRLLKLYALTSKALHFDGGFSSATSPYHENLIKLRIERLKLEEKHLKELNRLTFLERLRGPKPKW